MHDEDRDLTFITSDRLIDELCRRHDNLVVWGTRRLRTDDKRPFEQNGRVFGDYVKCLGLCSLAAQFVRSLINNKTDPSEVEEENDG